MTPQLREWVVHLGAWAPFVCVPRLLTLFAGLHLNRETARRQTEAAGAVLLAAETAAAAPLAPPADPGPPSAERLQVSADGAMVRLQTGAWVEIKTVAVGRVVQQRAADGQVRTQTQEISYFSRHASAEEFTRWAVGELHRRGVRRVVAVAGVLDGAVWLQGFLDYHRPDAVRILDLPHAAEHLGAFAAALWGEGAVATGWQAAQVEQLREHGAGPVLAEVARLEAMHEPTAELAEHGEYLRRRAGQMDYPQFRAAGWPIGSGIVESGNKVVVEARLKGAGMGWGEAALNPMLALRNAVCNDRWAEAWETIWAGQGPAGRRGQEAGAEAREAPASAAGSAEKEAAGVDPVIVAEVEAILEQVAEELATERARRGMENGRPGPGHPWRRQPLGRPH